MADKKISQLTAATVPLAGTEVLPVVQGGSTVKVSVNNLTAGKAVTASQLTVENNSSNDAVRITQTGAGNALVVEDSANPDDTPFVVTTSGVVIVGHTSPISDGVGSTPNFQLIGNSTATACFIGALYENSTSDCVIAFAKSRNGTIGSQTIVQSGDGLGTINFEGSDGTGFKRAARIQAAVDGTPGANDMPGRLMFSTTADGAASPTERMRIDSAGNVGIGTSSPGYRLTVSGGATSLAANQYLRFGAAPFAAGDGLVTNYLFSGITSMTWRNAADSADLMYLSNSGNLGLGTSSPSGAARLDVSSTTSGFLPPRMTTTQRNAITSPPNGLMLYNSTTDKLQVRAAGVWVDLH